MLITIIVPYKDSEQYIARCIDSLKIQTGDFEFILVNDGSIDNGKYKALERTEGDHRFKIIDNQRSAGVSGARNTGMDMAGGEWITFLDADDVLLPEAYKKFTAAINKKPGANIHQFNHVRYYTSKNIKVVKYRNGSGEFTVPDLPSWWFGVWNKIYCSEFVKDIRFDESLQFGEDGLFVLECIANGTYIHHGPSNVTTVEHIFENKQSLSHIKKDTDLINQIRKYIDFLNDHSDPELRLFICEILSEMLGERHVQKVLCNE